MGVMTNSIMVLGRVNVFHVASQSRGVGHVHLSAAWHARRRSMGCWLARRGCGKWKGEHCDGDWVGLDAQVSRLGSLVTFMARTEGKSKSCTIGSHLSVVGVYVIKPVHAVVSVSRYRRLMSEWLPSSF